MALVRKAPHLLLILVLTLLVGACDTSRVDSIDQMNEGIKYYQANQLGKALEHFRKAVELNPDNHKAHAQMGMIYNGRLKDHQKAIEAFKRAAEIQAENSEYWYYLGAAQYFAAKQQQQEKNANEALKYFSAAKVSFEKAVDVDEYYAESYYRLGQVHEELGEISDAIDAYSNSVMSDPTLKAEDGSALAYHELGRLYNEYSFYEEAALVLRNGVANNPEDVKLHTMLGTVYLNSERYTDAISHYDKAFKSHQSKKGPVENILPSFYGLGQAYTALGDEGLEKDDFAEATKQYKEGAEWFENFVANAAGEHLEPQRIAAQGKASELREILKSVEKGELPKYIKDQREMNAAKELEEGQEP